MEVGSFMPFSMSRSGRRFGVLRAGKGPDRTRGTQKTRKSHLGFKRPPDFFGARLVPRAGGLVLLRTPDKAGHAAALESRNGHFLADLGLNRPGFPGFHSPRAHRPGLLDTGSRIWPAVSRF